MTAANGSKIRIKMGSIEVECEGSERFLKEELPDLLAVVSNLYKESGGEVERSAAGSGPPASGELQMTTATIAAKLRCTTGPDLILAAGARLTFVDRKDSFTRKELLTEMQQAKAHYKKSYSKNLSQYLSTQLKADKLVESSTGTYALAADTAAALRKQLGS